MTYYMLNIKHPTDPEAATSWLDKEKQAPVFFGDSSIAQLLKRHKRGGGARFAGVGQDKKKRDAARVVTIGDGFVWAYELDGEIFTREDKRLTFEREKKEVIDIPKVMPIRLVKNWRLHEVPLILASMSANRHFSSGTFVEIAKNEKYAGNVAALDWLWGEDIPCDIQRVQCLSSIGLETLVAKILESDGAFVPAYKGGFLKGIDLYAYPKGQSLCGLPLTERGDGKRVAIVQVKMCIAKDKVSQLRKWLKQDAGHCVITAEESRSADLPEDQYFTRSWFYDGMKDAPSVRDWLLRSTDWLPDGRR